MIKKEYINIIARYSIILLASFPLFSLFYIIIAPLTIYLVYFLLNLFYSNTHNISLISDTIFIGSNQIQIIPACIAGLAYYLLFVLNISTPNIKLNKRIKMIFFSFLLLLIINITRIFILSIMIINNYSSFEIIHKILWYSLSAVFVVLIWFYVIKIFNIKQIPIYSDIKYLLKQIK